jgi:hypothetical protein
LAPVLQVVGGYLTGYQNSYLMNMVVSDSVDIIVGDIQIDI